MNELNRETDEPRKKFYYDIGYEIAQNYLYVKYVGQAFWRSQAVLDEAKRLMNTEKVKKAKRGG